MERIFASGMREYQKLRERRIQDAGTCSTARAARCGPATSASWTRGDQPVVPGFGRLGVPPYVGLFGTVWGIMHAFTGLASLQTVTLRRSRPASPRRWSPPPSACSRRFPPWSPTTAFARDIDRVAIKLETFIEEFSNILQRNLARTLRRHASGTDMPTVATRPRPPHRSTRSTWSRSST
jgi:biopolymer transport protein TolQ